MTATSAGPVAAAPPGPAPARRGPTTSWLAARNPTVVLALLTALSVLTLFLIDPVGLAVLYAVLALGVLAATRLGPWRFLRAQLPFVAFGVGLLTVNALARPGEVVWPDLPVRVTAEGLTIGAALALRTLVIGVGAVAFVATVEPRRLMVSLVQHARVSPRYAYALLAGYRLLGVLPQQWRTITRAHAVRAPLRERGRRRGSPRLGVRALGRCAFTLLVTSVRSAERIAFALESRGLGSGPRTVWRPVALGWRDAGLVAVGVIVVVGVAVTVP
ncbi:energy-coupling factor transporter transmembrane component T family protein [Serinibacter arcticus]|uniref:Transmembrane component YkoC n=1 Tax=Serinibacter arcticus TaxID=1655435 RepID=A0A4Z1E5G2_9MICO|nr:energy-coupling factor transporter transmembrane component T [Serinibacter arcticus]TGO06118.1 Transmembrane component YkoC [Serinibacter arcticus]